MMQEAMETTPQGNVLWGTAPAQGLYAMLALAGAGHLEVEELRQRTRMTPSSYYSLLQWLQMEYLVDLVSTLRGQEIHHTVGLTERGEALLVSILEQTCELPEAL